MAARNGSTRQGGFTLAEVVIVCFIIALFAAMIMPNLANQQRSLQHREFFSALNRYVVNARENAISEQRTLKITLDSSRNAFVLSEVADDGDQERSTLAMPDGMATEDFTSDGQESNSSDWSVQFRPDGTAQGGGIELDDNGRIRSLVVTSSGMVRIDDGPAQTDESDEKWPAGETEKRG